MGNYVNMVGELQYLASNVKETSMVDEFSSRNRDIIQRLQQYASGDNFN